MKLLHSILFSLLMGLAVASHAANQDAQVDPLMSKITAALKTGKAADALPYFAELEGMELSLSYPLPESFHYYYISTLDKAGDKANALLRAKIYLKKYGKDGKHYGEVNEIINRQKPALTAEKKPDSVKQGVPVAHAEFSAPAMLRIPGKNYEIGKYEVTQAEWKAVMGNNPSKFSDCGDTCPVEQVNWNDVQDFLQKLNTKTGKQYRLPTEAEWEYACYGGNQSEYCGGNKPNVVAWTNGNSNGRTHAAGQKQANGYGLYDMSGNVFEWTNNCDNQNCAEHMIRGGSFAGHPVNSRVSHRASWGSTFRNSYIGFRVAQTLP